MDAGTVHASNAPILGSVMPLTTTFGSAYDSPLRRRRIAKRHPSRVAAQKQMVKDSIRKILMKESNKQAISRVISPANVTKQPSSLVLFTVQYMYDLTYYHLFNQSAPTTINSVDIYKDQYFNLLHLASPREQCFPLVFLAIHFAGILTKRSEKPIVHLLRLYPLPKALYVLFTIGLIMAERSACDGCAKLKTWSQASGICMKDLKQFDLAALDAIDYRVTIKRCEWDLLIGRIRWWCSRVLEGTPSPLLSHAVRQVLREHLAPEPFSSVDTRSFTVPREVMGSSITKVPNS